jgi:hypothetical protein
VQQHERIHWPPPHHQAERRHFAPANLRKFQNISTINHNAQRIFSTHQLLNRHPLPPPVGRCSHSMPHCIATHHHLHSHLGMTKCIINHCWSTTQQTIPTLAHIASQRSLAHYNSLKITMTNTE